MNGQTVKIPSITRKRKAAEATITLANQDDSPQKKIVASAATPAAAPPTPMTSGSIGMDSEEEYMSAMSTDDELMQHDSGDEITDGDGNYLVSCFLRLPLSLAPC